MANQESESRAGDLLDSLAERHEELLARIDQLNEQILEALGKASHSPTAPDAA